MMPRTLRFICLLTLLSCVNHDFNKNSLNEVVLVAGNLCAKSSEDMEWLQNLVKKSETDFSLRGDIYAIKIDSRIIFLHQPWIRSCLACVLYDCDGNRIEPSSFDLEELIAGMAPANRIYSSVLN